MYCTAFPSSKPGLATGLELRGLEGLAGREGPVGTACLDVSGSGIEQVFPVRGALRHRRRFRTVALGGGDVRDGEVIEGVFERRRTAEGVVDGGQVEGACVHVVLGEVLAQVLALDLEPVTGLLLGGALLHVPAGRCRRRSPAHPLRTRRR